ncbi:MAG TPA: DUF4350 domain-containing protein [Gemmatimonadales bacterium]|jgi:hypothetical protein|nr:DUF4350 domain-containing protein [Gemmatimonadales bacterium]
MRARTEAAIGVAALTLLAFVVGVLARSGQRTTSRDARPSTLLSGPGGSRALLEGVRALGIEVRRFRERPRELAPRLADGTRQALAILGPSFDFSPPERDAILAFSREADLVLAGNATTSLMRCFGYRVRERVFDSLQAVAPGHPAGPASPWVHAELVVSTRRVEEDSTRAFDVGRTTCRVPPIRSVDTLLVAAERRPIALRLQRADRDRRVILIADEELFRNRALRRSEAGPFALRLFQGRYDRVVFEEYHHGFGAQGSLAGATLAWSRRSPWGWAVWQLLAVGLLALLFSGIRFGPARPGIERKRRSPLEHVRALAVALSATRGHDEAIAAIVRGLRRRLIPPALRGRAPADSKRWLAQLDRPAASPAVKASLASLNALTRPGQPSSSVLQAANAVEDLWQDLKP